MLKCTFALYTIVHIRCALCLSSCTRCSMLSLFVETRGYWTKAIVNVIVLVRKIWRVTIQLDKCIWYTIHFMCKLLCVRHLNRDVRSMCVRTDDSMVMRICQVYSWFICAVAVEVKGRKISYFGWHGSNIFKVCIIFTPEIVIWFYWATRKSENIQIFSKIIFFWIVL